ncbi:MAG: arylsulfatase [Acidobacteria bacterium]|nr:arylsulfatase [Acidobacteriota bacterium]
MLSRRLFLQSAAMAAVPAKPNVVIVITDDQGYGDLSCHGNPVLKTPNIDKLHSESLRLTNYHVSPTCAPTRSALMTGRYTNLVGPWHTIQGRSLLHRDEVTIADCFRAAGYRTGIFGKWHLGDNYPFRPQDRGFDETLVHGGGGVWQTPDHFTNDYFDDSYWHNGKLRKFEGFCTDVFFKGAQDFIAAAAKQSRPFFCWIATNAPHGPMWAPEELEKKYAATPEPGFFGMIDNIDTNVGRMRAYLRAQGLDRNTIFIFTTDNGTSSGHKVHSAGMRASKGSPYEGGHRVPFFLHWPDGGYSAGRNLDLLAAHIDILPTLLSLTKGQHPAPAKLHGRSLVPYFKPGVKLPPLQRTLVTDSQRGEDLVKWRQASVMTQQWRLVSPSLGGMENPKLELYDVFKDPGQNDDVAAKNPDVVAKLTADYEKWWMQVSARGNEYARIVIGDAKENPSRLTCHDWHGEDAVKAWNQRAVRQGPVANGFWTLEARAGQYRIELRRWPKELDLPMSANFVDTAPNREKATGRGIPVSRARVKIGMLDITMDVKPSDSAAVFELSLPAGPCELHTWLITPDGAERGAYFVYVERV